MYRSKYQSRLRNITWLNIRLATKKAQIICFAIFLTCYINVEMAVVGARSTNYLTSKASIVSPLTLPCYTFRRLYAERQQDLSYDNYYFLVT